MRWCGFSLFSVGIALLAFNISLSGQSAIGSDATSATNSATSSNNRQAHLGYLQDWSSRQLAMPALRADGLRADNPQANDLRAEDPQTRDPQTRDLRRRNGFAAVSDPRQIYNVMMRQMAAENARNARQSSPAHSRPSRRMKIDWAVSLENGYVPQNQFPAKYGFNLDEENCNSDYIVFGLTVTSGTQANLVGINNLYTNAIPACNGGSPWVAFAYNTVTQTGGQIKTSPVLSEDGTKVAFVESTSSGSYFHVLVLPNPIPVPPEQTGTVLNPQTPASCKFATNVGCMTTLTIETGATNSNSSPWVDYNTDTAYVGADNGVLYKINPVFGGGAPGLVSNGQWPVTVAAASQNSTILTSPVEDIDADRIFLGDGAGYLYAVDLHNPAGTYAAQLAIGWVYDGSGDGSGGAGTGIVDPPIVVRDLANPATDQVFAFTGCSEVQGIGGAITQVPANFTSSTGVGTNNTVNMGSGSGDGDCTGGNIHQGTFDNAFWLTGTAAGHMIACGFVQGSSSKPLIPSNPQMYFFPFSNNVITSTASLTFIINQTVGEECSPLTAFDNGLTDRLFFGVGGLNDGHLESSIITNLLSTPLCTLGLQSGCVKAPGAMGGTSGIILDNEVLNGGSNIYFSTLAGGSVNGQNCSVAGGASNPYCAVKLTQLGLQ